MNYEKQMGDSPITGAGEPSGTAKRERLSIDLEAYPDVKRMLERLANEQRTVTRTRLVIDCLRRELTRRGYARKKDLVVHETVAAMPEN